MVPHRVPRASLGATGGGFETRPYIMGSWCTVGVRGNDGMVPHRVPRGALGSTGDVGFDGRCWVRRARLGATGRRWVPPGALGATGGVGCHGRRWVPRATLGSTGGRVSNPPLHYGVAVTVGVRGNDGMVPHRVPRATLGSMGDVGFDGRRWVRWATLGSTGDVGFDGRRWVRWATLGSTGDVGFDGGAGFKPAPTL